LLVQFGQGFFLDSRLGFRPAPLTRVALRFDKIAERDRERIACHILAAHRSRPGGPPR
jgi:hypothetical protein